MRPTLALAALALAAQGAAAAPAIGLSGDRTLVMIDTATAKVTRSFEVRGIDALLGIDLRPGTGEVYGVTLDHEIVTIDLKTGKATVKAKMDRRLPVGAAPVVVDFNPAADKLRFMTGTVNHRVDVDSGKVTVDGPLAFQDGDMHKGETPAIVGGAYTNAFGKPEKAALYNIDATIGAVIQQVKPNDGTLAAIGKLGIEPAKTYAFDVQTTADGTNTAWLVADATLHTVSLETGKVTGSWDLAGLPGAIRDLTILPAK